MDRREQVIEPPLALKLPVEKMISALWNFCGVMIYDCGEYNGFIKKSHYIIYLPPVDSENYEIISFKRDDCKAVDVYSAESLRRYLRDHMKRYDDYWKILAFAMRKIKDD